MNIIECAEKYIGMDENTAKHRAFIDKYNREVASKAGCYNMTYSDPWCAAFVSLCAHEAGIKEFPFSPNCETMRKWAISHSRWVKTPAAGSLVLYDWNGDGVADHVGIVKEVNGSKIKTIEGNTSDSCAYREYPLNSSSIMGYVKLEPVTTSSHVTVNSSFTPEKGSKVMIPVVRYGNHGIWVLAMQALLTANGYPCGEIDGEYGMQTKASLLSFQKAHGLLVDGECGKNTWKELVGG